MRRDRPPYAHLNVDALEAHIRSALRVRKHRGHGITFRSGGQLYRFYRFRQTSQIMVRVTPDPYSQPAVVALAARLARSRVCPVC